MEAPSGHLAETTLGEVEEDMATSCVYGIENRLNGKRYIGSATDKVKRWHRHRKMLRTNTHPAKHLQAAWNKYGKEAFDFRILEVVEDCLFLTAREQFWIWRTRCGSPWFGYNTQPVAGSSAGRVDSVKTRRKKSEAQKQRWGNGYKHGPEAIGKMREANLGNRHSLGRKMSDENREKLRIANLGKKHALGTKRSDEWKQNLSRRMKVLNADPEWKRMHSERVKKGLEKRRAELSQ